MRIIRTLREMNIVSVAVYSLSDKNSDHVRLADEAYLLTGESLGDTYLNIEKIVRIAVDSKSEAVHPGYGFLSENPVFPRELSLQGINFIGPDAEIISMMGDKEQARRLAKASGVPVLPGIEGVSKDLFKNKETQEFPLLVKASAGGGGKAMRIVRQESELHDAIEITSREALNYFGDDRLIIEKFIENARHIEVQVLADHYGNCLILGDRDCTVQRRHQKVIEEAPAPDLKRQIREELHRVSLALIKSIAYLNAGTIEFLLDEKGDFYFLEMNTRIQVEHPVTEMVTGIDIVKEQIQIAAGNKLTFQQDEIIHTGHAIEVRLYAEDPETNFRPSPGEITFYKEPVNPGLRIDSSISGPIRLSPDFDPMIAKVVVHAPSRQDAIHELRKSLSSFYITGTNTNRELLFTILGNRDFNNNSISTSWLERNRESLLSESIKEKEKQDGKLILISWMIKRLSDSNQKTTDLWERLGKWRQFRNWQIIFENQEINIRLVKNDSVATELKINDMPVSFSDEFVDGDFVRFRFEGVIYNALVIKGKDVEDQVVFEGYEYKVKPYDYLPEEAFIQDSGKEENTFSGPRIVKSPLHGRIIKLNTGKNMAVSKGDTLLTLDAMKIENKIISPLNGYIKQIFINEGDQVEINQNLVEIVQE